MKNKCEAVRETKLSRIENGLHHVNESIRELTHLKNLLAEGDISKESTKDAVPTPRLSTADMLSHLPDVLHSIANSISDEISNIRELLL